MVVEAMTDRATVGVESDVGDGHNRIVRMMVVVIMVMEDRPQTW